MSSEVPPSTSGISIPNWPAETSGMSLCQLSAEMIRAGRHVDSHLRVTIGWRKRSPHPDFTCQEFGGEADCGAAERRPAMAGASKILGMNKLKVQNALLAGALTSFVGGVYFYTMKAVGSGDDLQEAVNILQQEKEEKSAAAAPSAAS